MAGGQGANTGRGTFTITGGDVHSQGRRSRRSDRSQGASPVVRADHPRTPAQFPIATLACAMNGTFIRGPTALAGRPAGDAPWLVCSESIHEELA